MFSVNPKCISLGELYGEVDQMTMEWSDGLLAAAIRAFAKHRSTANKDREADSARADSSLPVSRNSSRMSKASNDFEMDVAGLSCYHYWLKRNRLILKWLKPYVNQY